MASTTRLLRNKILVVGDKDAGLLEFVKGVFTACEKEFPQKLVDDELKKSDGKYSGVCIPWVIDTKYYTASVDFWLDEVDGDAEVIKGYADQKNEIGQVVDAFVYAFRKDKAISIKNWVPFLEGCEPSIQLCVGSGQQKDDDMSPIEDWCLDHQFEYVDLEEKTVEPLDKAGWDLAVDVLQTNLWDGMSQKEPDNNKNNNVSGETVYDDDDFYKELQMLSLEKERNQMKELDDLNLPSQNEIKKMQQQLFGDLENEGGLDKAFETMQALREQGNDLPDEERRKLAAKVALSFAAQLGV
ncbi:hypothetical protein BDB00DRAFT_754805 [Zychaea mexicana]|uniref:uncharacterized protein n=1 Tax=Zychaea mexicana TaxID=64656 RepID=UPI0022FE311A|nr:uncharacterized protein BDB00DRAFT_754805 [Zychaea mexicana]KAI9498488.1 hypothetical protein BDB00DRAFT_754805 [Zychaea mexicana]